MHMSMKFCVDPNLWCGSYGPFTQNPLRHHLADIGGF
uniref:Uncharacterized protein n=1 Tax=Anguilla anguilla TaxID=7936 RepID=A0A0E9VCP6_ANGAN